MQNFIFLRNVIAIFKHKYPVLAQIILGKFVYIQICSAELLASRAIMVEFPKNARLEM